MARIKVGASPRMVLDSEIYQQQRNAARI